MCGGYVIHEHKHALLQQPIEMATNGANDDHNNTFKMKIMTR